MDKEKQLSIIISAEIKNFEAGLKKIEAQTQQLSDSLSSMAKISSAAFAALAAGIGYSVSKFAEADTANQKLSKSLQQQGIYSESLMKKYDDLATSLEIKTGADGEAVKASLAATQGMLGEIEITEELTNAVADLAVAKEIDLATAFNQVTRAISEGGNSLGKYGVEVATNISKSERMSQIISQLNSSFGGQADAVNPAITAWRNLNKQTGDFVENIGEKFAPTATKILNGISSIFETINKSDSLKSFVGYFTEFALISAGVIAGVTGVALAVTSISKALAIAKIAAAAFGVTLNAALIATGIGAVLVAVTQLALNWDKVKAAIDPATDATVKHSVRIAELTKELEKLEQQQAKSFTPEQQYGYQRAIDETRAKIAALKEEEATLKPEAKDGFKAPTETTTPTNDKAIELERQKLELIMLMNQEHRAAMAELNLADDATYLERQNVLINAAMDKANTEYQIELDKNKSIQNAREKAAADNLALAKKTAAEEKILMDKELKDKMAVAAAKQQIESQVWQAAGLLAEKNAELTKALNIAQAIRNTYQGATLALSTYPPPFGAAAAAATVAVGMAQVAKITGANKGALVTGGVSGKDTEPFMLSKGEIVAPEKSYDSVIDGELRARGYVPKDEANQAPQQQISITINTDVIADDNGINALVERIKDAIRYNGASLV